MRVTAVAASLLISLLTGIFRTTPNNDAYTYIRTAEVFVNEGLVAAFGHYEWATYSVLIGIVHRLTGLELFSAAYLLNAMFYGLLTYSFVSIIKEINDSKQVLLLSVITVLFYPQLNEFRHEIIRDIGFWSFSLFAISQYMVFSRTSDYRHILFFSGSLLLAATFRSEAIIYLLTIPLSLLFDTGLSKEKRLKYGALTTALSLGFIIVAVALFSLVGLNLVQLMIDFVAVYSPFLTNTLFPTDAQSLELGNVIFNEYAASYSSIYLSVFMVAGLTVVLIANVFNGIGGPYFIILVVGYFRKMLGIPRSIYLPLLAVLIVNLVILFVFIMITRFLAGRYTMLLAIVLALFVPIVLNRILLWADSTNRKRPVNFILGLLLIYCTFDSFISFGYNKNYIYEAALWVNENSTEQTLVLTNDHATAYFSGRVENYDLVPLNLSEQDILQAVAGSLIVIDSNYDMRALFSTEIISTNVELIKFFPDESDQRLLVYRKLPD